MRARTNYKWWSTKEKEKLRELHPQHSYKELAKIFGRSFASIAIQCSKMGLRKKGFSNEI